MIMRNSWFLSLALTLPFCGGTSASLVDDIVDAITHAVDCGSCHALLVPIKGLAELGDSAFSSTIIAVCKTLGVGNVCGTIKFEN